jgi:hypothetical protein
MHLTGRLDPMRLRSPRIRSLLRYAAVAGLLALAAGTLLIDPSPQAGCRGRGGPAATAAQAPTPGRTPTAGPLGSATTTDRTPDPPAALTPPRNTVGVPVQLAEPGTAAVLRPGDRVDVIARTGSPDATTDQEAVVLAHDVLVISSSDEGIVYLAIPPRQASRVSQMAPDVAVGVTVHPT